jgi:hypothetical protein
VTLIDGIGGINDKKKITSSQHKESELVSECHEIQHKKEENHNKYYHCSQTIQHEKVNWNKRRTLRYDLVSLSTTTDKQLSCYQKAWNDIMESKQDHKTMDNH